MIHEYYQYIKNYFTLVKPKKSYVVITFFTSFMYKMLYLTFPFFISLIVKYITLGNKNLALLNLFYLVIAYIIYSIFYYFNHKIYGVNQVWSYTKLQQQIYHKLMNIDEHFTKKISKGKVLNIVNGDILYGSETLDVFSETIFSLLQLIFSFVIVLFFNVYIGLFIFIYIMIYLFYYNYNVRKYSHYLAKQKRNADQYSNLFGQILEGLQEIKTFDMFPKLEKKLNTIKRNYSKNYFLKRKYYVHWRCDVNFISHIFKIAIYFILLYFMVEGSIDVSILVLVISYFETMEENKKKVSENASLMQEYSVYINRINSILTYQELKEVPAGLLDVDDIDGVIEFKNVSFSYQQKKILDKFNLKIEPNKITAIVGQTGSGKSTIMNLLLRFYKVDEGSIDIDGMNIYDYTKEVYSKNVSIVNQKPFIFNMSIRKNLDFVDHNIAHQIAVCKKVGIHDFIMHLPKGYNTILRENATNISGGQKQLISFARTLLSKAEILLLDEISAALDPETLKNLFPLLEQLKQDHTIVMVTHKPEMMRKADRIIVLHEGKIVGDGTHNDLIKNNEHYQWLQARKSASILGVFDS